MIINKKVNKRVVTFSRMGIYTDLFKQLLENLGVEVMLPPPITENTIKLGVRYSSSMICYPFKITLGSFIEALEMAKQKELKLTYLGVGSSSVCMSSCRFQQYFEIQKKIAEDIGYNFDTIFIEKVGPRPFGTLFGVISAFKKINPKNSYLKIIKELIKLIRLISKTDEEHDYFDWNDKEKVKIGIVGEFYTVVEPKVNYDIINKLRDMGINVHTFVNYSNEYKRAFKEEVPKQFVEEAKKHFKGMFRAHGDSSYHALYFYKHHNFDAVIHLTPLSCMPQQTAQCIMDITAKRLNIPLFTFAFDEESFKTGFDMRLNSIVSILKRKKKCIT